MPIYLLFDNIIKILDCNIEFIYKSSITLSIQNTHLNLDSCIRRFLFRNLKLSVPCFAEKISDHPIYCYIYNIYANQSIKKSVFYDANKIN